MKFLKIIFIVVLLVAFLVGSFFLTLKADEATKERNGDYLAEIKAYVNSPDFNAEHNNCIELGYYKEISDKEVLKCLQAVK